MSGKGQEMEDLRAEVRDELKGMSASVAKLADSIHELVIGMRVTQERENQQKDLNQKTDNRLTTIEKRVDQIILERAKEEQSRNFVTKYWPWIMVFIIGLSVVVSAFFSGVGRGIINSIGGT